MNPKQIDESYIHDVIKARSLENKDSLKNLLVLFKDKNEQTRSRTLFEISMVQDDDVFFILNHLVTQADNKAYKKSVMDLLLDKARTNTRFIIPFIDHATPSQLKEAIPLFATVLLNETDTHILQKTIHAIGKTKEKSCINVIADFIFYDHELLKREAISALGEIGGPSVIKRLAFASSTSMVDDYLLSTLSKLESGLSLDTKCENSPAQQFASRKDTLERLSADSDIAQLMLMLNSPSPLDRHLAIDGLIESGVQAIPAVVANMAADNTDSLINGLDILGNIANETALPPVLKILNAKHPDSNVRFAAYEALSKLPLAHAPVSLVEGITDPSEQVRIAAATAINKNPPDILISGLKSKIETAGKSSSKSIIISAIIDSHSDKIFTRLLDSDSFMFLASDYLTGCHESTLDFFSDILIKRGTRSRALTIQENIKVKTCANPLTVFCVDDSKICLRYYTKLFYSMGHRPVVFDNPEQAMKAIRKNKPDVLTTDLNIVKTHGLQLIEKIRNIYSLTELPIVVITTQKDFVESGGQKGTKSQINMSIYKPLDYKVIKPLMDQIR